MNKTELIAQVAEKAGLTKAAAEKAINAFTSTVIATVAKKKAVQLIGFGTFDVRKRKARNGVNPVTKEKMKIAATTVPGFRAGKAFKEAVAPKKVVAKPAAKPAKKRK